MPINNVFASVAVKNLNAAVQWYEKLFGRAASRPVAEVAQWDFAGGGSLQVYLLPERAGAGSFTLVVSSIDEQADHLSELNIDTSQRTNDERIKTIMITDPDGNHIAFSEVIVPLDKI